MTKHFSDKVNNQYFILDELRRGNERAFEFAFHEYYASLIRFSYSFVKDQNKAESIVQEVFIKLWEKRDTLSNIENLMSYLMSMVHNQSIDFLRKEKAESKAYLKVRLEKSENTTEEQISKNEFEESLLHSLQKLPERCRTAFELSRFEGLQNKEIAQKMEISIKGVEALIGRSLKLLRIDLEEFLPSTRDKKGKEKGLTLFTLFLKRKVLNLG